MKFDQGNLHGLTSKQILMDGIAQDLEQEMESHKRHIQWFYQNRQMVEAMPELPQLPDSTYVSAAAGDIFIQLPRIQSLINEIRNLPWNPEVFHLEEIDNSKSNGMYILKFHYLPTRLDVITFNFSSTMKGATCELIKIGEEEKITCVPIYEVVCKEGAEEHALEEPDEA